MPTGQGECTRRVTRNESMTNDEEVKEEAVGAVSPITNKEGVMKTQRSLVVSIGALVLGGLLVTGSGIGITPAGADDDKGERQKNPLMQILNKLDKILDAIKGGGGQDGNHTLRWDQVLPAAQRFVVLAAFNSEARRCWIEKPAWCGRRLRKHTRWIGIVPAPNAPVISQVVGKVGACPQCMNWRA